MSDIKSDERELGKQPLDEMMMAWGLGNHDLVEVSTEQLTHKQVQKARNGRRLSLKMMQKVTRAFNVAIWYKLSNEQKEEFYEYMHRDLFNYAKGSVADWKDPNESIIEEMKA